MELVEHEDLFHTSDGKAFVTLKIKQHRETYAVASEEFRTNLLARFYGRHHRVPTANTIESAPGLIAGKALFEGPERKVFLRVAESEGDISLDLGNKEWDVVRVDRSGWSVVKGPPVRFRRSPGMTALPIPQPGGSIDDLRPFVNLPEDDDWILFVATLVAALRPTGPYPILEVLGGQGSGKTTLVRITQKLVDPSTATAESFR